uniref:ANAPC4_WD40 domain-containing protein n=1 Tax=Heterorhabditis bacteriophora TaxID=37862 RepID=A0A1I7X9H1_HETBA
MLAIFIDRFHQCQFDPLTAMSSVIIFPILSNIELFLIILTFFIFAFFCDFVCALCKGQRGKSVSARDPNFRFVLEPISAQHAPLELDPGPPSLSTNSCLPMATEGAAKVCSVACSPSGMKTAVAARDRSIVLLDENGEQRDKFATKPVDSKAVTLSSITALDWPFEDKLLIGLMDGKVRVGLVKTNKCTSLYKTEQPVVSMNSKRTSFVSGHQDGSIILYTFSSKSQLVADHQPETLSELFFYRSSILDEKYWDGLVVRDFRFCVFLIVKLVQWMARPRNNCQPKIAGLCVKRVRLTSCSLSLDRWGFRLFANQTEDDRAIGKFRCTWTGFLELGFVLALGRAEAFASALNSRLSFGRGFLRASKALRKPLTTSGWTRPELLSGKGRSVQNYPTPLPKERRELRAEAKASALPSAKTKPGSKKP